MDIYELDTIPEPLRMIPDPPQRLFACGELPTHHEYVYVSIIGSRKYSDYGQAVTEYLISGLRDYPIVIVSGLAFGIDALAHRYALENNLKTVALPGSSLDQQSLYPAHHRNLAQKIVTQGGALLSELPSPTTGAPWTFPRRNRLMAGISQAVIVIEAEHESGTKITARLALDYGRDVCAVPGSIFSPTSQGTHDLLHQGAIPISSPDEIIEVLGMTVRARKNIVYDNLSDLEKSIINITAVPHSINDIARKLCLPIQDITVICSSLEIQGLVLITQNMVHRK